MKRFSALVMALMASLCLSGLTLDAQAYPHKIASGDQMSPSDGGNGTGGGGGSDGSNGADGSGGEDSGGGGGSPVEPQPGVSVPRIMLTGFAATPAEVEAGKDFTVSFTLLNTSPNKRVENIKVTLSSGESAAFLPANGSSSLFIRGISSGDQAIETMSFHSLPSLEERPYQMTLNIEYEDTDANPYQSQETVAVPVTQSVRADTSVPQVVPEMLQVGQDASVAFSIHNQGKTKLYNAKAVVKDGQAVSGQEVFIGTIEPGASGAVDMIVHADEETTEPLMLEVSYEDVDGKTTSLSKEVPMSVMPMEIQDEFGEDEFPEDEGIGIPWLPIVVGVGLLLLLIVLLLVRRSRRRSKEQDDMDSMSMLSDDPLVPTDGSQG